MINNKFWNQVADRWTSLVDISAKEEIESFGNQIASDTGGEVDPNFSDLQTYINTLDLGGLLDDI